MEMGKKLYLVGSHCPGSANYAAWADQYTFQNTNTPKPLDTVTCNPAYANTTSVGLSP